MFVQDHDQDQDISGHHTSTYLLQLSSSTIFFSSLLRLLSSTFYLLPTSSSTIFIDMLLRRHPSSLTCFFIDTLHTSTSFSIHIHRQGSLSRLSKRWTKVLSRLNNEFGSSKRWISLLVGRKTLTNLSSSSNVATVEVRVDSMAFKESGSSDEPFSQLKSYRVTHRVLSVV